MSEQDGSVRVRAQLKSKTISLQESLHRPKLLPILEDANRSLLEYNKSVSNDSIVIDTEHVIYIENGPNYHTYTFNIINNNDATSLKNLVLTPLPNGEYMQLIFSYNL